MAFPPLKNSSAAEWDTELYYPLELFKKIRCHSNLSIKLCVAISDIFRERSEMKRDLVRELSVITADIMLQRKNICALCLSRNCKRIISVCCILPNPLISLRHSSTICEVFFFAYITEHAEYLFCKGCWDPLSCLFHRLSCGCLWLS